MIHERDRDREVLFPRALPFSRLHGAGVDGHLVPRCRGVYLRLDDYGSYHWVAVDGHYSLRKGAPPKIVQQAAAGLLDGDGSLNDFLDRIGVPKAKA